MASDSFTQWLAAFRSKLKVLSKVGRGCLHCSGGTCLTYFATESAAEQLGTWHLQWRSLTRDEQDVHLLWMFAADPHSNAATVIPDERIPTSPDDDDGSDDDDDDGDMGEPLRKKPRAHSPMARVERIPTSPDDDEGSDDDDDSTDGDDDDGDMEEPLCKKPRS